MNFCRIISPPPPSSKLFEFSLLVSSFTFVLCCISKRPGFADSNCSTQLAREKEIVLHVLSRVRVNEDATTIGNSSPHDEDLEPCAGTFDWCALDEGAAAKRCPRTRLSSVVLCRLKQPNFSFHSFSSFPTKCDKKKNAQNTFDRVVIS